MSLALPCVSDTRGNPSHPYSSNFGSGLGGRCERKLMFMAAEFEVNSKYSMTSSNIISPFREMEFISAVLPVKNCETKYKEEPSRIALNGLTAGAAESIPGEQRWGQAASSLPALASASRNPPGPRRGWAGLLLRVQVPAGPAELPPPAWAELGRAVLRSRPPGGAAQPQPGPRASTASARARPSPAPGPARPQAQPGPSPAPPPPGPAPPRGTARTEARSGRALRSRRDAELSLGALLLQQLLPLLPCPHRHHHPRHLVPGKRVPRCRRSVRRCSGDEGADRSGSGCPGGSGGFALLEQRSAHAAPPLIPAGTALAPRNWGTRRVRARGRAAGGTGHGHARQGRNPKAAWGLKMS